MNIEVSAKTEMKPANNIIQRYGKALEEIMRIMEAEAVRKCPVDTGLLRASIHIEKKNSHHYIMRDGVDYGIHCEWGTLRMRPQPFFRPALALAKIRLKAILRKHLKGV